MSDLCYQRRLASELLKCGRDRVWLDERSEIQELIAEAVTRADIRRLINSGAIQKRQKVGISKGRLRHRRAQQAKGRQRGHGSRKGAKGARTPRKQAWMARIRAQRLLLHQLRAEEALDRSHYRFYYRRAKGGMYHSRNHMLTQMRNEGVLAPDYDPAAPRSGGES